MKVQHLTLGASSVIRDTADILPTTEAFFKNFAIAPERNTADFHVPGTALSVKITATPEGAMFNIMKGEELGLVNACCFSPEYTPIVLAEVEKLSNRLFGILPPMMKKLFATVKQPESPQWIYTVIVGPLSFTKEEMMLCGEIELYIYHELYKARI